MTNQPSRPAPSPSGSYRPPLLTGSEPMTTPMRRIEAEPPAATPRPSSWFEPARQPVGRQSVGRQSVGRQPAGRQPEHGLRQDGLGHAPWPALAGNRPEAEPGPAGRHAAEAEPGPAGQHPAEAEPGLAGRHAAEAEPGAAGRHAASGPSALRLVWIYPDLLSTYGDRGNLLMLMRRATLRGLTVDSVEVNADQPVPHQGDIYLLGGGEDLPQILAARRLRADGGLRAVAQLGAVIFAVCAGYQLMGEVFGGVQGEPVDGLGILDIRSGRGERRGVGEVVADVDPALGVDRLTGFENHQGVTALGGGARPLARVLLGVGNGDGTEGAYAGHVLGSYLHGPALVRNPGLADLLLGWVAGSLPPLAAAEEHLTRQLRAERLAAVAG